MTAATHWLLPSGPMSLDRPRVMAIVNLTPDSFSDGGRYRSLDHALDEAARMVEQGADILDVGGESTRPGAEPVGIAAETDRVLPFIEGAGALGIPLSVDTRHAAVAASALEAGAEIVNDVSAGADPDMFEVVASARAALVLMHMRGDPTTMQLRTDYDDLPQSVRRRLEERAAAAMHSGVSAESIALDPGIGFGKSASGNLELMTTLPALVGLGYPVLVGASRKSFLGKLFGHELPDRLAGSLAAACWSLSRGARILRVHDVADTRRALDVTWALMEAETSP